MQAGVGGDLREYPVELRAVAGGEHEPQVVAVFALVVVVDLGVLADALGDPLQTLLGHRQGSQGAGPGALVAEHRADPRQRAVGFQAAQPFEHLGFAATQGLGHPPIGFRADRQAFLVAGEEAAGEVVHGAS